MDLATSIVLCILVILCTFVPYIVSIYYLFHPITSVKWYGYHTRRSTLSDEIYFISNRLFFRAYVFSSIFVIPVNTGLVIYMFINGSYLLFALTFVAEGIALLVVHIACEVWLYKYMKKNYRVFEKRDSRQK